MFQIEALHSDKILQKLFRFCICWHPEHGQGSGQGIDTEVPRGRSFAIAEAGKDLDMYHCTTVRLEDMSDSCSSQ